MGTPAPEIVELGMKTVSVTSSNIKSVGYDRKERLLQVNFLNDTSYQYRDVPKNVYEDLISAGSVGAYFNDNIKNTYSFTKL